MVLVADRSILGDVNAELSVRVQPIVLAPSMLSKGLSTPGKLSDTGMLTDIHLQGKPKHVL